MKQILNKWQNNNFIEKTLKMQQLWCAVKHLQSYLPLINDLSLKLHLMKYQSFKLWVAFCFFVNETENDLYP